MNRYKATLILIAASIGFLICYPFSHFSFIAGLLSSGFAAAMIGGVADWFGVTALFRRPLGVPFRTEIIPKNREKIFDALSDMVGSELLSRENLRKMINRHNMSDLLIKYIKEENKKEDARKAVATVAGDILRSIDSEETGRFVDGIFKENIAKLNLSSLLASAAEVSIKNGYDERIIDFVIGEAIKFSKGDKIKDALTVLVEETMRSYEKDKLKRKLVNSIVFDMLLQQSPADIAAVIQGRLEGYLNGLRNPEHELRVELSRWISEKIEALRTDSELRERLEKWKLVQIEQKLSIQPVIIDFIEKKRYLNLEQSSEFQNLLNLFDNQVENFLKRLQDSKDWQDELDGQIKRVLLRLVESSHGEINKMVRDNLNKFSNEMLVDLIESRAGNDLQMIRINGSVVGGFVGMLVFLFNYCIGL